MVKYMINIINNILIYTEYDIYNVAIGNDGYSSGPFFI